MSSLGGTLKSGATFDDVHFTGVQIEGTVEAREQGSIRRNGLIVGFDVLCNYLLVTQIPQKMSFSLEDK